MIQTVKCSLLVGKKFNHVCSVMCFAVLATFFMARKSLFLEKSTWEENATQITKFASH